MAKPPIIGLNEVTILPHAPLTAFFLLAFEPDKFWLHLTRYEALLCLRSWWPIVAILAHLHFPAKKIQKD
jgi:hypothetical protein